MTLHRFFVDARDMEGERFAIPASIVRQVRHVLRLTDGDRLVLLPGDGSELVCRLEANDCIAEERRPVASEPRHRLTLAQALLKGDGLEDVVRQGTEIGVAAFRLIVTERCIAREISERKLERLRTIAREAAEQSERGTVPAVDAPVPLADLVTPGSVMLYERHGGARLAALDRPSMVIIGPEGGFSPDEVRAATAAGATLAGLGPRILRSQTVGPAVAAAVLSRTGDFA